MLYSLICEYNGDGILLRKYVYGTGIDEIVRMSSCLPLADITGSVIAEYDGLGRLRRKFLYGTGIDEVIMLADFPQKTDLTDDGIVDVEDLLVLAENWLCESNYFDFDPDADLNGDGIINFEDYAILTGQWHTPGRQNGVYFYHYDGLGSVAALSDSTGQLVESYKYDVFGSFIATERLCLISRIF